MKKPLENNCRHYRRWWLMVRSFTYGSSVSIFDDFIFLISRRSNNREHFMDRGSTDESWVCVVSFTLDLRSIHVSFGLTYETFLQLVHWMTYLHELLNITGTWHFWKARLFNHEPTYVPSVGRWTVDGVHRFLH